MGNLFPIYQHWQRLYQSGAHIGWKVVDGKQENIDQFQSDRWFVPASNQKLWTTSVALDVLGPDFCFHTWFGYREGALFIQGGGDPVFSWQDAIYMVRKLQQWGVDQIQEVVLDDSIFLEHYGTGWMWDDFAWGYAAPIHALNFEMNRIRFHIAHDSAQPRIENSFPFININIQADLEWSDNEETVVQLERTEPYGFHVTGQIAKSEEELEVAAPSGPDYFIKSFLYACRQMGIWVAPDCQVKFQTIQPLEKASFTNQFTHLSPPLSLLIQLVNQESRNIVAETILRAIGLQQGVGRAEQGINRIQQTLQKWNVPHLGRIADGSGLSTYNLCSPASIVELLQCFLRHPQFSVFLDSLAEYGKSGTLQKRELILPKGWKLKAKTGTLYGVKSLSGYLLYKGEVKYIFSLLINGLLEDEHGVQLQDLFIQHLTQA